ncbi:MAG: 1,4-dihydroxy-2-naphthoate octaprenyltransferase [Muribaculaceae bacterium]|nr:1,4-dihydroxy-2-naphthoate octaprenyltransferase [Muribaculaceae bacterium]MBQ7205382.1 1,4-dihydroxy-2-naphthoate octaprenyltransferase [Muribaculaceae bacterium]
MNRQLKIWLECFRLRTLPVSLSGVVIAIGLAKWLGHFHWKPAVLCLVFGLLAQIVSNTANEYFDFKKGTDKPGRVGPRRGVTEGDISPKTLRNVTFGLLVLAGVVGCCLIPFGGWWLLPMGIVIALAALAYSTGPYPLSYHGLGELMVFIFFGIVPVNLTYYVQALRWDPMVILFSITIGLLAVNVLLVNNYRDVEDDREAGKRTSVVIFGRQPASLAYLINGFAGMGMLSALWVMIAVRWGIGRSLPVWTLAIPVLYLIMHTFTWYKLTRRDGAALNPLLGETARNMLIFTLLFTIIFFIYS